MKNGAERPDFDFPEQDILSLLKEVQEHTETEKTSSGESLHSNPSSSAHDPSEKEFADSPEAKWLFPLIEQAEKSEEDDRMDHNREDPQIAEQPPADSAEAGAPAHAASLRPQQRIGRILRALFPEKGDTVSDILRKTAFFLSLAAFIISLGFLLYDMVLEPRAVQNNSARYTALYHDTAGNEEHLTADNYPTGMQSDFRQLYDINPDIAGWLSFHSTDSDQFLQIDLPVVHCGDNQTYLSRAFDGSNSRSGTLFFDANNKIAPNSSNKVTIIYGHNMASGMMFAKLNRLINSVYYARSAPLITMNTLYQNHQYEVFAVVVVDEDAPDDQYFNYLRASFTDDDDFLNYIRNVRAHSLYNYPVKVEAYDEILVLSTCTNRSQVKVSNGRLAIFARRVRNNDSQTDVSRIAKNEDVIMPYAWYTAQKLTPHAFYIRSDYTVSNDGNTGSATTATNSTATESTVVNTVATEPTAVNTTATEPTAVNTVVTESTVVNTVATESTVVNTVATEPTDDAPAEPTTQPVEEDNP